MWPSGGWRLTFLLMRSDFKTFNEAPNQGGRQKQMGKLIYRWGPVVAYCTAIFVQSSFPTPGQLPSFAFSDKLLHVLAYAILGALVCRGAKTINGWRDSRSLLVFIGTCAATLFGISDEWHQSFVAGRSAELADALADFAGGLAGSGLYVWIMYRRGRSTASGS